MLLHGIDVRTQQGVVGILPVLSRKKHPSPSNLSCKTCIKSSAGHAKNEWSWVLFPGYVSSDRAFERTEADPCTHAGTCVHQADCPLLPQAARGKENRLDFVRPEILLCIDKSIVRPVHVQNQNASSQIATQEDQDERGACYYLSC